jgi:aminomethyltransferase
VDDAYLYRVRADEYLLVVNAANRDKDIAHLRAALARFPAVELEDCSAALAMLSLQGPRSEALLLELTAGGALPPPRRNALASVTIDGAPVSVGRTGYTGEPRCFELFLPAESAGSLWDRLVRCGACPVGLGARDTLRLEAALPLYGHELGAGPGGAPIPIFACGLARFAVSLAPEKGDFIGRRPLERQARALSALSAADPAGAVDLPQRIQPLRLSDKGVARAGNPILAGGVAAGVVTSGTMVPYWKFPSADPETPPGREKGLRAIALALVDARLGPGDEVAVVVRERHLAARIVRRHLQPFGPYARAVELPAPQ